MRAAEGQAGRRLRHLVELLRMRLVLRGETDQRIPLVALQHPSRSHLLSIPTCPTETVGERRRPQRLALGRSRSGNAPSRVKPKRDMDA